MTEDEMVEWHHRLNGHEFEQSLEEGEGQGSLVCCSRWGHKESDTIEQLNNNSTSYLKYYQAYQAKENLLQILPSRVGAEREEML